MDNDVDIMRDIINVVLIGFVSVFQKYFIVGLINYCHHHGLLRRKLSFVGSFL